MVETAACLLPEAGQSREEDFEGAYREDGEGLFIRGCRNSMRGDSFKWKEGTLRAALRKKFFTARVARHWARLPGEVVGVPSLDGQVGRSFEQPDLVVGVLSCP